MTVAVVDYGMGNLRSVAKALEHVSPKSRVVITSDAATIRRAERVVFPGQGAMPDCMRYLADSGLTEAILEAAATKPLFGVCVGEQMLFERSEEGDTAGTWPARRQGGAVRSAAHEAEWRSESAAHGMEPRAPVLAASDVERHRAGRLLLLRA